MGAKETCNMVITLIVMMLRVGFFPNHIFTSTSPFFHPNTSTHILHAKTLKNGCNTNIWTSGDPLSISSISLLFKWFRMTRCSALKIYLILDWFLGFVLVSRCGKKYINKVEIGNYMYQSTNTHTHYHYKIPKCGVIKWYGNMACSR